MEVVNLKGRKPQKIRESEVYIGRQIYMGGWRLSASKWQNPYTLKTCKNRTECLQKYEKYIRQSDLMNDLEELRGKKLACWCAPEKCHGEVLMKLLKEI